MDLAYRAVWAICHPMPLRVPEVTPLRDSAALTEKAGAGDNALPCALGHRPRDISVDEGGERMRTYEAESAGVAPELRRGDVRISSHATATTRVASGAKGPYTRSVMATLLWPSWRLTINNGTPR